MVAELLVFCIGNICKKEIYSVDDKRFHIHVVYISQVMQQLGTVLKFD